MSVPAYDCSFEGIPFRLPTRGVLDWIDAHIPLDEMSDVAPTAHVDRTLLSLSMPWLPTPRTVRVGELWWPTGLSRCAIFRGLATREDAEAMADVALPTTGGLAGGFAYGTLRLKADGLGGTQSVSAEMFLLSVCPLTGLAGDEQLCLVTLVDERYLKRFDEQDGPAPLCSSADGTDDWPDLAYWHYANFGGMTPHPLVVDSAYGSPEPDSAMYGNASQVVKLDAIAANIGGFFTRDWDGGNYLFQRWDAALTATAAARLDASQRLAGGAILDPDTGPVDRVRKLCLPRSVWVEFPGWVDGFGYYAPEWNRTHYKSGWGYGKVWGIEVFGADLGEPYASAVIDINEVYQKAIRTTAKAILPFSSIASGSPAPNNTAVMTAMAEQLAKDYYAQEMAALDEVYQGIQAWPADTGHDILWTWTDKRCCTRVTRRPHDSAASEFQHSFGALAEPGLILRDNHSNTVTRVTSLRFQGATVSNSGTAGYAFLGEKHVVIDPPASATIAAILDALGGTTATLGG